MMDSISGRRVEPIPLLSLDAMEIGSSKLPRTRKKKKKTKKTKKTKNAKPPLFATRNVPSRSAMRTTLEARLR